MNENDKQKLSLRSKELFPQPVCSASSDFKHGAVFDWMSSSSCHKCDGSNMLNRYIKTFICNICGDHIRYLSYENQYVILQHILDHGNSELPKGGVYPIINHNFYNMKKLQVLVHIDPDGFCAKCVMCGDNYETKTVDDITVKRHIENCKRILQLRTGNKSLPVDLINNFPPKDSPAYSPVNRQSKLYSKHYRFTEQAVNKYRRPLGNALTELYMCDHCGFTKIRCRICNVYSNVSNVSRSVREIAYIHLLNTNVTECENGIFNDKQRSKIMFNHNAINIDSLHALNRIFDSNIAIQKKYVVKLIAKKGCLICGSKFENPSYDMFKLHMDTAHADDH